MDTAAIGERWEDARDDGAAAILVSLLRLVGQTPRFGGEVGEGLEAVLVREVG